MVSEGERQGEMRRMVENVRVHLVPVTKENIDEVLALQVREDQKSYVSSTAESLAQAYVYAENAFPFAVYDDETVVGFIMMGYYEVKHYYTLWKLMIDYRYQGKGYGREALKLGTAFLKERFNVSEIYTGVLPENKVAKNLYRSFGFENTGLTEFGMEEMRMVLH